MKRGWQEHEIEFLKRLYGVDNARLQAGLGRSWSSIKAKAERVGLALSAKFWTTGDVTRLRELYPDSDWGTLLATFPGRSKNAIKHMAEKLEIRRKKKMWLITREAKIDWRGLEAKKVVLDLERRIAALESFLVL